MKRYHVLLLFRLLFQLTNGINSFIETNYGDLGYCQLNHNEQMAFDHRRCYSLYRDLFVSHWKFTGWNDRSIEGYIQYRQYRDNCDKSVTILSIHKGPIIIDVNL